MIISVVIYVLLIVAITVISMLIVSFEPGMDTQTSLATVATALNNNGIEIKSAGVGTFSSFSWWSRLVYIIDMLIGRLEIFPILAIFVYAFKPVKKLKGKFKRF